MIFHPAEDVVVDVAEELDFRLDTPVVSCICERGVVVEHARVPPAHLMVGDLVPVLDIVFFQYLSRFVIEIL